MEKSCMNSPTLCPPLYRRSSVGHSLLRSLWRTGQLHLKKRERGTIIEEIHLMFFFVSWAITL